MQDSGKKLTHDIQECSVECMCYRKTMAVYYCNVEDCKDKAEKYYCMQCKAEDDKHISHKAIKIQDELKARFNEWESLVEKFRQLKDPIDVNYSLI